MNVLTYNPKIWVYSRVTRKTFFAGATTMEYDLDSFEPWSVHLLAMWGDAPWSRAVSRLTGGGPSHVALAFLREDSYFNLPEFAPDVERERAPDGCYIEALFGRGVRRPRPVSDAYAWAARRPSRRIESWPLISLDPADQPSALARRKFAQALTWVGAAGYGHLQILAMLLRKKIGWPVRRTIGRVVCSELVARIMYPEIDLRDGRDFDETTPANTLRAAIRLNGRILTPRGAAHVD